MISRSQLQGAVAGPSGQMLTDPGFKERAMSGGAGRMIASMGGEALGPWAESLGIIANASQSDTTSLAKLIGEGSTAATPVVVRALTHSASHGLASASSNGSAGPVSSRRAPGWSSGAFAHRGAQTTGRRGDIWHARSELNLFQIVSTRTAATSLRLRLE